MPRQRPAHTSRLGSPKISKVPAVAHVPLSSPVDTRQAYYPHELPAPLIAELNQGYQGEPTPDLDQLMK
jgi:hypothetical protein